MRDDVAFARSANEWTQQLVEWAERDATALAHYQPLGIAEPWAAAAVRALPLAAVGATTAAAATNTGVALMTATFERVTQSTSWAAIRSARDGAVATGLAPVDATGALWAVVEQLPTDGRLGFTARIDMYQANPPSTAVHGWCALDCINAWCTDTTNALIATTGLDRDEVDLLAAACRDGDASVDASATADALSARGLVSEGRVTAAGATLHGRLVDHIGRLTATPWQLLGIERAAALVTAPAETDFRF